MMPVPGLTSLMAVDALSAGPSLRASCGGSKCCLAGVPSGSTVHVGLCVATRTMGALLLASCCPNK